MERLNRCFTSMQCNLMDIFASMLQKKKRETRTSNGLGKNQTTRFVHLILIYSLGNPSILGFAKSVQLS